MTTTPTTSSPIKTLATSSSTDRRIRAILLALVVLTVVLRMGAVFALKSYTHPNPMEHKGIAIALLRGEGFAFNEFSYYGPSSVQSPPYPLLLATLYTVFGTDTRASYIAAMLINSLAAGVTTWIVFHLARRMGAAPWIALGAAALYCIWPTQIYAVTVAQAISLITLTTVAVMWLFYVSVDTRKLTPWIAYGFLGCLGALTEPVLLPFMALSGLLILFWPKLPWPIRIRNAMVLFFTALLVIGPWSYRNWRVHDKFVPVKNTVWVNIWKGANPYATGTDRLPMTDEVRKRLEEMRDRDRRNPDFDAARQYDMLTSEQRLELDGQPEVVREQIFRRWARQWIKDNPREFIELSIGRLVKTLWIEWDNPKGERVYQISRTLLLIGSAVGIVLAIRRRIRLAIPLLVVGSGLLTYTITITAARFALPYEPLQIILSSLAIAWVLSRFIPALRQEVAVNT